MKIKDLRIAKGITREEFVKAVGLRRMELESYEAGHKSQDRIPLKTALKMCDVLGCNPSDLLD